MQQGPVGLGFVLSVMDGACVEESARQGDIIPGLRQGLDWPLEDPDTSPLLT